MLFQHAMDAVGQGLEISVGQLSAARHRRWLFGPVVAPFTSTVVL